MPIQSRVEDIYERANQKSGKRLDVLRAAFQNFSKKQGAEVAAGLAYYALFSIFPLLLTLTYFASYFLERERTAQAVIGWLYRALPVSREFVSENVTQAVEMRGSIGLIGLIGLLWSASGVFMGVAKQVNQAWEQARPRNFLQKRLVAFGMVGALAVLFLLSLAIQALFALLPAFDIPLLGNLEIYETGAWIFLSNLLPWSLILLLYLGLYLWIPTRPVNRKAAFWSALLVATAWKLVTAGFAWYLQSGLSQYELVYGSLGAVVALMFLVYLLSEITIFGAHLCVSLETWIEKNQNRE